MEKYKAKAKKVSIVQLCRLLGYSKQAYYKQTGKNEQEQLQEQIIKEMIAKVRNKMSRLGGRKLLIKLQDKFRECNLNCAI